jgi:hypothetical protein
LNVFTAILCLGFFCHHKALKRKIVMYVEGTLYPSISLLEIGRDIMPTPQGREETYAYLQVGEKTVPLLRNRHKNEWVHFCVFFGLDFSSPLVGNGGQLF